MSFSYQPCQMLYDLWIQSANRYGHEIAVHEMGLGRKWEFAELRQMVEKAEPAEAPVMARSGEMEFFVQLLRAWKYGQPAVLLERGAEMVALPEEILSDCALIKISPQENGESRAICFTAAQICADAGRIVSAMGMHPNSPNLAAISMAHSYGFSSIVMPMILHGVPLVALAAPFPALVESVLRAHSNLTVSAVPAMWRAWQKAGVLRSLAPGTIRLCVSAGAPLAIDLERSIYEECGLKVHNFYGASECGAISWDAANIPRIRADDLGSPFPGVGVTVTTLGELLVESDAVAASVGGKFLVRDQVLLQDGRLHLVRSNPHVFNIAGRKIAIKKIELALQSVPGVVRSRVVGLPSADLERVTDVAALVEMEPSLSLAEIKIQAAKILERWAMPRRWWEHAPEGMWSASVDELNRRWPHHH